MQCVFLPCCVLLCVRYFMLLLYVCIFFKVFLDAANDQSNLTVAFDSTDLCILKQFSRTGSCESISVVCRRMSNAVWCLKVGLSKLYSIAGNVAMASRDIIRLLQHQQSQQPSRHKIHLRRAVALFSLSAIGMFASCGLCFPKKKNDHTTPMSCMAL